MYKPQKTKTKGLSIGDKKVIEKEFPYLNMKDEKVLKAFFNFKKHLFKIQENHRKLNSKRSTERIISKLKIK